MKEADVRARLVEALQADLVGPFLPDGHPDAGQETLPIAPSRWYLTGFLAPQGARKPDEADLESVEEELGAGDDVQTEDAGATQEDNHKRPIRFPASMGLSVYLPPGSGDRLEVDVRYADYDRVEFSFERDDKKHIGWKRVPHGPVTMQVPLDAAALARPDGLPVPGSRGLVLRGELRTADMDGLAKGTRVLSLFLVNDRAPAEQDKDERFVFQVGLVLRYAGGFVARPNLRGDGAADYDLGILALNFRDKKEWAVGHNTSLERPKVGADGKVTELRTTQLPCFEVPRVEPATIDDATTAMQDLAKLDGEALGNALRPIVDGYGAWIERQRRIPLGKDSSEGVRDALMNEAARARDRIQAGIALLARDPQILRAFSLANLAMHAAALQADRMREDPRYKDGKKPAWRPFQLAFVLMNLAAMADPAHPDRKIADLIYFPTGGGKTEAYLGLIAFTLVLRRLRGKGQDHDGRGVAVLLRYTLRLLTLDQLGRAATLICALEELRRRSPAELGNARFTIGLWVGSGATANRLADVHRELSDHTPGRVASPFPLAACPWCGEPVKLGNIKLVDREGRPTKKGFVRVAVYCDRTSCLYTEAHAPGFGLPVLFVDEQIYDEVPCFVVATVDKFAMMPWRGDAGMLFGRATHLDEQRAYGVMHDPPAGARRLAKGLLPPELVVQDELHLISGPLGTMVGLYEAAVDYLCEGHETGAPRPPKIVCSTATVRRAKDQIQALFGRETAIFPPRGVDDGDNFFSRVVTDAPGRLYVGIGAPGRALRAVSVRSYATLLAAGQKHFDPKGKAEQPADPYMTLVGYFNSLRELGGMRRLVEDEVRNRVRNVDSEDGRKPPLFFGTHPWAANRNIELPAELTSRESTDKVKETKARLGARRTAEKPEPLDVVLASNMISVGLDIDRLGLMVVTGQPKTTSEYIQATSRVGRAYPGLVAVCFNVMRPRDRSHYERFVAYHDSFYREVEATSVTPFSGQALDRGLVGTLVSMVRHAIPEMEAPTGFMKLHPHRSAAEQLLEWLVRRAGSHKNHYDDDAERRIQSVIRARGRSFFDAWERVAQAGRDAATERTYSKQDRQGSLGKPVLFTSGDEKAVAGDDPRSHDERAFEAPMSMRDVEPNAHVWLRFKQLDERNN